MAFCSSCGASIAENAEFCPQCGKPPRAPTNGSVPVAALWRIKENLDGGRCYMGGWVTGIFYLLGDRRPFVRFHAAQSLVVFGVLHVLYIVLQLYFRHGWLSNPWNASLGIAGMMYAALILVTLVLWILLMVKAFKGERFRVPIAGAFADWVAGI